MIATSDVPPFGLGFPPLVRAVGPALLLCVQLRSATSANHFANLWRRVVSELRDLEARAATLGVANEECHRARIALCAALNEVLDGTSSSQLVAQARQALATEFRLETASNNQIYGLASREVRAEDFRSDFAQLLYLCIVLGLVRQPAQSQLSEIRDELLRNIQARQPRRHLRSTSRVLSHSRRLKNAFRPDQWWAVGLVGLVIVALTYITCVSRLAGATSSIYATLAVVGLEDLATASSVPWRGPTVKQLLAPDEASGTLTAHEEGERTVITVLGHDLFGSGSATVNTSADALLNRVGAALNRVPGRILVIGHSDDQPLRSLRFTDNYTLSRERAASVAGALQRVLDQPGRVEFSGVGPSQPLDPGSGPESRRRNRRVEIIHVR